ncbi:membrane-associated protein [Lewinella aquimaris]|uniref:Membrane-associated protein n=1 Tax=Neolewinella aquimaris TaxID=1835722 RepID=A0A840EBP2_9BACT|nr:VTT domain-containing protein [Neolewinella aquimaris]MBB4079418.1 membrane-associated protein [Neolewinella aquimaris]
MGELADFFFHIDESLRQAALLYPVATYGLLFAVIYTETAFFPLAPFFPGDGLLFAIGVLAAGGLIHPVIVAALLVVAASLGAWTGYRLGRKFGPAMFKRFAWLDRRAYTRSHAFYRKYGATALITSRFLPIVKALVPFVAGVAEMERGRFARYNVMSAAIWVISLVALGYFLGNVPFIRDHTSLLVLGLAAIFIGGLAVTTVVKLVRNRGRA